MQQLLLEIERSARERFVPIIRGRSADVLQKAVLDCAPHRILEIGTAVGYSGILMLNSAPSHCILDTAEILPLRHAEALQNFLNAGLSSRVNCFLGDASSIIEGLRLNKYDFVFIDGAKSKYKEYIIQIDDLLNNDAIIFADNVNMRGLVFADTLAPRKCRTSVRNLKKFIQIISDKDKYDTQILDLEDGIAIIRKKV